MAETPRIRALTRQGSINIGTPQAFSGGIAGPGMKMVGGTQHQQMTEALGKLIEYGTDVAVDEQKKANEEEVKRGEVRMANASAEEIEKLRRGTSTNIIDAQDNKFYREGVNRGLLRVYGRRFGSQALIDWQKSKAYGSSDPDAFSNWMQDYTSNFNKNNIIEGFESDLVAEELLPVQRQTANVLQQRHQEKQAKQYRDDYERLVQKENYQTIKDHFSNPEFRHLIKRMNTWKTDAPTFLGAVSPVMEELTEALNKLKPKQGENTGTVAYSKRASKLLTPILGKLKSEKLQALEGTSFFEAVKNLDEGLTKVSNVKRKNQIGAFISGGEGDSEWVGVSPVDVPLLLEQLKQEVLLPNNPVNRLIELNNYINTSADNRRKQGIPGSKVNGFLLNAVSQVAIDHTDQAFLNVMLPALEKGRNTEYMLKLYNQSSDQIFRDRNTAHTTKENERKEAKRLLETNLKNKFVLNVPWKADGTGIDFKKLTELQIKISNEALASPYNIQIATDINNYVTLLQKTKGVPTDSQEQMINDLFMKNIDNPTIALEEVNKSIALNGLVKERVPRYNWYKSLGDQHKSFPEDFFKTEWASIRTLVADAVKGEGKVNISSDGVISITGDFQASQNFDNALAKLETFWETHSGLPSMTPEEWRKEVRTFVKETFVDPAKQAETQAFQNLQNNEILRKPFDHFEVSSVKELIQIHNKGSKNIKQIVDLMPEGTVKEKLLENSGDLVLTDLYIYWRDETNKSHGTMPEWLLHLHSIEKNKGKKPEGNEIKKEESFKKNQTTEERLRAIPLPTPVDELKEIRDLTRDEKEEDEAIKRGYRIAKASLDIDAKSPKTEQEEAEAGLQAIKTRQEDQTP